MALNLAQFEWRLARRDDAADMLEIYNESVDAAGHSPVVKEPVLASMQWLVSMCGRCGFPIWTLRREGELVAWAMVRAIAWGPEVCARAGDFSVYVAERWQGRGVPMLIVRNVYCEVRRHGFDAITCWIFSTNRKSLTVARAFRMEKWGHLPCIANIGGLAHDVEIWGIRLDDPKWSAYMELLDIRHKRRQMRLFGAGMPP
ncbi:phosphinothricin acetyltransferase [Variovorax boronicumulans]|uniref:GNAT family N-acetyltransferase n=1 Tax=Variovorax boronicumulans TaxID=436515 RepID=UPI00277F8AA2|nr:GNAT family N-acetyltransferase [Variovorax boronicumulans]MDQ0083807.1 phosphinothricin acetyltransferase [Variovorax boronicumulans]